MNFFKTCLVLSITFHFYNCKDIQVDEEQSKPNKEQLLQAIEQFNEAFRDANVVSLSSLITENYVHTNSTSKAIGKTDWLNYMSQRKAAIASGSLTVIDYKMTEVDIQYYGKTALVTGKVVVSTQEKEELRTNEYRITNVWVNQNGKWKRAGFHDGKIK